MKFQKPKKRGPKPRKRIARTSRPARVRRTPAGSLELTADHLFSLMVLKRAEGRCEACGQGATDCAHGERRGRKGVRWHGGNAWALCRACHRGFGSGCRPGDKWWTWRYNWTAKGATDWSGAAKLGEVERLAAAGRVHSMEEIVAGLRRGVCVQGNR